MSACGNSMVALRLFLLCEMLIANVSRGFPFTGKRNLETQLRRVSDLGCTNQGL
jgi:hypothetical protein